MKNYIYRFLLLGCFLSICAVAMANELIINEICAKNEGLLADAEGDFPDWIELYNPLQTTVDLENYRISDGDNTWSFPALTLAPQSYLLLFASDKNTCFDFECHTNFRLSAAGEEVTLYRPDGTLADRVVFPALADNHSYGRSSDNTTDWIVFSHPSPRAANAAGTPATFFTTQLTTDRSSGFYPQAFPLNLTVDRADVLIYYTLDGSLPDTTDFIYSAATELLVDGGSDPDIARISTSDEWQMPAGAIQTAFVLRAAAFRAGVRDSEILNRTYWIDAREATRYTMPVVSILTENAGLFAPNRGIYVKGDDENYYKKGREWERPVHAEFFDADGELLLAQDAGLRLGGAKTRIEPQKTIRLYAREEYGNKKFAYPFWGDEYADEVKKITLRTMNLGPWSRFGFTDDLAHAIIDGETRTDHVRRSFAVVFINGVYWGIHSLREHNDEHFLARKYDTDDNDIVKAGKAEAVNNPASPYYQLLADIESMDLRRSADYREVAERLDIPAFTDYIITNLAFANRDWPDNNTEFWHADTLDAKIRFLINDLDATMTVYNDERLNLYFALDARLTERDKWNWALLFMQKLLSNDDFRRNFNARLTELLTTVFAPDRTVPFLRDMRRVLRPELAEHIRRWHFPSDLNEWEKAADRLELFLLKRPDFLLQQTINKLGSAFSVRPNPTPEVLHIDFYYPARRSRSLTLYDTVGRKTGDTSVLAPETTETNISLSGLSAGVYILRAESDGIISGLRVVKL